MLPKLSVALISYNHEKFIALALESIVAQRTNFVFDVVVGDDCSTDGTPAIIQSYAQKHPRLFKVIQREHNIGAFQNVIDVQRFCQGEYLAWLEGDDYWTDPLKLQKQVDLLDANPGCSLCFGHAKEVDENNLLIGEYGPSIAKPFYTLADLLEFNFVPSCTVVHRHHLIKDFPPWFTTLSQTDWSLFVLLAHHGTLSYIPEDFAARRIHRSGMWMGQTHEKRLRNTISSYLTFKENLPSNYRGMIDLLIAREEFRLAVDLEYFGRTNESWTLLRRNYPTWIINRYIEKFKLFKLLLKFCLPWRRRASIA